MISEKDLIHLGKINKAHGVFGEMSFALLNEIYISDEVPCFFVEIDGIPVPFFIEELNFRTNTAGTVKFQDIDSSDETLTLSGMSFFVEKKYIEDEDIILNDENYFSGYRLMDENAGDTGIIQYTDTTTENHLFVVEKDGKEILVPVSDAYVKEIDHNLKIIYTDLPDGLLSL